MDAEHNASDVILSSIVIKTLRIFRLITHKKTRMINQTLIKSVQNTLCDTE